MGMVMVEGGVEGAKERKRRKQVRRGRGECGT